MAAGLEFQDLRSEIGGFAIQTSFEAPSGSVTAILGASGAGKSTLLALACGFEQPASGQILVDGRPVTGLPPAERPIAILFQEHNLFPHLTAFQNIGLGLDPGLRLTPQQRNDVADALDRVGLGGDAGASAEGISRAGNARGLPLPGHWSCGDRFFCSTNRLPASGPALRRDMLDLVDALCRDTGMTVVMVTHDPADARRIAGFTAFMHEGTVQAFGPTETVLGRPDSLDLRSYLGVETDT